MLDLLREGALDPSADDVAQRAGVGRRTVFRLFEDMESLYVEMQAMMLARTEPIVAAPFVGGAWRARLDELVERRANLFEEMLPVKSAADRRRPFSPFLQARHEQLTRDLRRALRPALPDAIWADRERLDAIDLALSFDVWRRLRMDQRLSPKQARAVMQRMVDALTA
jgi:AcrR family transcriptional regulator